GLTRDLEVGMPRAAPAPQRSAGRGGGGRRAVGGDRQSRHLHAHDRIGVALVLGTRFELPLLPGEEPWQVPSMRSFEVASPEVVGLHHVKVAVEDQKAVACHVTPPALSLQLTCDERLDHLAGAVRLRSRLRDPLDRKSTRLNSSPEWISY